jgi:hypothetical protein
MIDTVITLPVDEKPQEFRFGYWTLSEVEIRVAEALAVLRQEQKDKIREYVEKTYPERTKEEKELKIQKVGLYYRWESYRSGPMIDGFYDPEKEDPR